MTTLTVKANALLSITDDPPSIPAYLHPVPSGMAVILLREAGNPRFCEHWCVASAYVDEAEEATPLEVEAYLAYHDAEILPFVDDVPEPVSIHDQEIWSECHDDVDDIDFFMEAGIELDFEHDLAA